MNTPLKIKHLLIVLVIFLLGAGVVAGTGLYDNIVLGSYADFKTPSSTPANSASGVTRLYYDPANQGLVACSNACPTPQQIMAGRNKIINGNFNVWQRGTALTTVTTGTNVYLADRWFLSTNTTGSNDESQSTNISGVNGSYNAILIQPHTTNTAGAGSLVDLVQVVEGYNLIPLNNQVCTISFWAKASLTGTYGVSFRSGGADESYVIDWVVSNTNWNKYVYTFTHSNAAGTWLYTNGIGMYVTFSLVCGSTFQQTTGSWQAGNKVGSANMTNTFTNSTSNTMTIAQVQLEQGPTATQFEQMDYGNELNKCLRYCEFWSNDHASLLWSRAQMRAGATGDALLINMTFAVPKRTSVFTPVFGGGWTMVNTGSAAPGDFGHCSKGMVLGCQASLAGIVSWDGTATATIKIDCDF